MAKTAVEEEKKARGVQGRQPPGYTIHWKGLGDQSPPAQNRWVWGARPAAQTEFFSKKNTKKIYFTPNFWKPLIEKVVVTQGPHKV